MRVAAARWLPVPVLHLEHGDIVDTGHGAAKVRGWVWNLTARRVRLDTVVLRTGHRYGETFTEDATVRCRRR